MTFSMKTLSKLSGCCCKPTYFCEQFVFGEVGEKNNKTNINCLKSEYL